MNPKYLLPAVGGHNLNLKGEKMTTPMNMDVMMPYAVNLGHANTTDMQVLNGKDTGTDKVNLSAGSYNVMLSYDGAESAAFAYRDNRTARWTTNVGAVAAGTGPRSGKMVPLGLPNGGTITVYANPKPAAGAIGTATLHIYPLPPQT